MTRTPPQEDRHESRESEVGGNAGVRGEEEEEDDDDDARHDDDAADDDDAEEDSSRNTTADVVGAAAAAAEKKRGEEETRRVHSKGVLNEDANDRPHSSSAAGRRSRRSCMGDGTDGRQVGGGCWEGTRCVLSVGKRLRSNVSVGVG